MAIVIASAPNERMAADLRLHTDLIPNYKVIASRIFRLQRETRGDCAESRLSSFGFSGTIAHARIGTIVATSGWKPAHSVDFKRINVTQSLFRGSFHICGHVPHAISFEITETAA